MILYHGTDIHSAESICKNGIDVNIGSVSVDLGQSFYTNTDRKRVEAWAKRKSILYFKHNLPLIGNKYRIYR